MYKILTKRTLGPQIREYIIEAPEIARVAKSGQFIVLRLHERGERVPLTIVDADTKTGGVTIVVQEVGKSTREMGDHFHVGDDVLDFVGPLGVASEIDNYGTVICVGGGLGIAPLYPITRDLKKAGNTVIGIIGARNKDLLFYIDQMDSVCDELIVMTDDGSNGNKGFVSNPLHDIIASGREVNRVWAIGPGIMMKVACNVTREFSVPTVVSLNSIMIDGTGMCGSCRVEVGGEAKFACVDGPEFDGHKVNFDLLMSRQRFYHEEEKSALDRYLTSERKREEGARV
ncbi:MAG: sulfide/dihydroorotate dehydrogenase-like FAD/NAD-binding protein [Candidatus Bipolaricaulota bacterium]|nr:sulfide/dihydroorotate dehydrogenase-like FAD/NAD-binding protein [Candidatus Bipolaricaulota bacterium]